MAAVGDFNFSIRPQELSEKGEGVLSICARMRDSLDSVENAMRGLESWESVNKERYEEKIKRALPSMYELVDVIESYGNVAIQTSQRATAVEQKIASAIDNDLFE